jgi:hypothetical protein
MDGKEQDLDILSEDEAGALNFVPPIDEEDVVEPGPTPEKQVEQPPTEPPKEEPTEKKVEPPPEPPPQPKPDERPPAIDGILAKDGKNVIPFSVLEDERSKRQALETEIAELRKKPPEPPPKVEVRPPEEPAKPKIDLKALAKDFATNTYKSEEDAVIAAENLITNLVEMVTEQIKGTATEVVKTTTLEAEFTREVERIKTANPWITEGKVGEKPTPIENALFARALEIMDDRKVTQTDVRGMVKAAEDAVAEGKTKFKVDQPDLKTEVEKARKEGFESGTKALMAKLNIKEEPQTLADVRNVNPNLNSKFEEMDNLIGVDLEEAYAALTPEEREGYLRRTA